MSTTRISVARAHNVHLSRGGVSVIADVSPDGFPIIRYWGAELGSLSDADLDMVALADQRPAVTNAPNAPIQVSILPEQSRGWMGSQGLLGHHDGAGFSPRFRATEIRLTDMHSLDVDTVDQESGLGILLEMRLSEDGLLGMRATVTNLAPVAYQLEALTLFLPVPIDATEILDFSGRHLRERSPQRTAFTLGSRVREGRRGKPGVDSSFLTAVGTQGFGFRRGEVWALHVAWSGNGRTIVERSSEGVSMIGGGELLHPGEIELLQGDSYASPWVAASWGEGLDAVSARFHSFLRHSERHPSGPRPVVLNTWEAVYFEHSIETLRDLVQRAGEVGIERFVLDDGWFGSRRDDTSGLGDWYVSPDVWPTGLGELISLVHSHGMDFGLWFEPEMINLDSELARAHPEWIMTTGTRFALPARSQQVLDLTHPEAFDYLLERIDALLTEYDIAFIKWDHNRDLVDAGHSPLGRAAVHNQTLALYRLLDQLQERHPGLEIESCSSGGGRVDLEILQHTQRIWASDCIDPLERQDIQRWTGLIVPLEYMGSHVGNPRAETTGRVQSLDFRAATAFFGSFGVEWDITQATETDRAELAAWISAYKAHRQLLHTGTVVRSDHADPAIYVTGVVADDHSEALFSIASLTTSEFAPLGRVTLPGLDEQRNYQVQALQIGGPREERSGFVEASWWSRSITASGRVLARVGVQTPVLRPEEAVLLHVTELGNDNIQEQ